MDRNQLFQEMFSNIWELFRKSKSSTSESEAYATTLIRLTEKEREEGRLVAPTIEEIEAGLKDYIEDSSQDKYIALTSRIELAKQDLKNYHKGNMDTNFEDNVDDVLNGAERYIKGLFFSPEQLQMLNERQDFQPK